MMIEKSGSIRLKDIPIPSGATPEQRELAQGMVRVNHLYRSALKVAVTQMEILTRSSPVCTTILPFTTSSTASRRWRASAISCAAGATTSPSTISMPTYRT